MDFLHSVWDTGGVAVVAVLTTLVTGALKMPLKKLAARSADAKKLTRYITFLPLAVALALSAAGRAFLGGDLWSLWVHSSGMSLAIYAFFEKFFPGKSGMTAEELAENRRALGEIAERAVDEEEKTRR